MWQVRLQFEDLRAMTRKIPITGTLWTLRSLFPECFRAKQWNASEHRANGERAANCGASVSPNG
jgi:hypothetical protein